MRPRSRRAFLGQFGKGAVAMAVFTPLLAACASDGSTDAGTSGGAADGSSTTAGGGADDTPDSTGDSDQTTAEAGDEATAELRWARANLGFVSAYVLARGSSAAIIDTGAAGSVDTIGETLSSLGLSYSDVDHVILTHKHADHIGSISEVLAEATSATVYAGEADLASVSSLAADLISADDIIPLLGDEEIFGLRTVATPGHTIGHMAVLDENTGLLVAGDALFTEGGAAIEGPEQFFNDVPQSQESIRTLAALSFNTLLVGHGDPIDGDASAAVAELAASLP